MKLKLSLILCLALLGCNEAETYDTSGNYMLPEGLSDCKVFYMKGKGSADNVVVVRCPNSQTAAHYKTQSCDPNTNICTTDYHRSVAL